MPSLDRKLRFQLFLLHEGRNHYRDYRKLIARMSGADPVAMSRGVASGSAGGGWRNRTSTTDPLYPHGDAAAGWRGLRPETVLRSLPILTKDDIREHFASLHSVGDFPGTYKNTSGGSTGHPVVLTQDAELRKLAKRYTGLLLPRVPRHRDE